MDGEDPQAAQADAGDPACWAALVCPSCGAIPDSPAAAEPGARCPRCGEPYPDD